MHSITTLDVLVVLEGVVKLHPGSSEKRTLGAGDRVVAAGDYA